MDCVLLFVQLLVFIFQLLRSHLNLILCLLQFVLYLKPPLVNSVEHLCFMFEIHFKLDVRL